MTSDTEGATMPHATTSRIAPIELADLPADQRQLASIGADTVVRVLARNPGLLAAFQPLGGFLIAQGSLDGRIRELVILRVALRCDAPYEWGNHAPAALGAGATEAELAAISDPTATWSPADDAALRAADELCADACVSDATWAALSATRDDAQILELLFLIGFYRMMAGFLNSAGVPVEPGRPALGEAPAPVQHAKPTAPTVPTGKTGPTGTWNLTFVHPAGSKPLILTLEATGSTLTGSMHDPQLGIDVPITTGTAEGNQVTLTAHNTQPVAFDITAEGTIDGDAFTGTVTITGGGTFPLEGFRAA